MPIAPMPTVSEAVTKPLMNWLSLSFPDLCLSHAPNLWKSPSMSIISPMSPPRASEMTMLIVPVVPSDYPPSSITISLDSEPAAPMNMTANPVALSMVS